MRFVFELTIPSNTLSDDPEETEVSLITGTLKKISIGFPPGCAAMAKVIIRDKMLQISPANPDSHHAWDNYTEVFSMNYKLTDPAPLLTLVGWSDDTIFQHVITFRFDVVPSDGDEKSILEALMGATISFSKGKQ